MISSHLSVVDWDFEFKFLNFHILMLNKCSLVFLVYSGL